SSRNRAAGPLQLLDLVEQLLRPMAQIPTLLLRVIFGLSQDAFSPHGSAADQRLGDAVAHPLVRVLKQGCDKRDRPLLKRRGQGGGGLSPHRGAAVLEQLLQKRLRIIAADPTERAQGSRAHVLRTVARRVDQRWLHLLAPIDQRLLGGDRHGAAVLSVRQRADYGGDAP